MQFIAECEIEPHQNMTIKRSFQLTAKSYDDAKQQIINIMKKENIKEYRYDIEQL